MTIENQLTGLWYIDLDQTSPGETGAVSYVTINGLKLTVLGGTWHPRRPAPDWGTGINGDRWRSVGAEAFKWQADFTARYQKVGATGYASKTDVFGWAVPQTMANTLLTCIDVNGVLRNVFWVSEYLWDADTYESAGDDEWYEIKVKLVQR